MQTPHFGLDPLHWDRVTRQYVGIGSEQIQRMDRERVERVPAGTYP